MESAVPHVQTLITTLTQKADCLPTWRPLSRSLSLSPAQLLFTSLKRKADCLPRWRLLSISCADSKYNSDAERTLHTRMGAPLSPVQILMHLSNQKHTVYQQGRPWDQKADCLPQWRPFSFLYGFYVLPVMAGSPSLTDKGPKP